MHFAGIKKGAAFFRILQMSNKNNEVLFRDILYKHCLFMQLLYLCFRTGSNDCESMKPRVGALSTRAYENMRGVAMFFRGCNTAFAESYISFQMGSVLIPPMTFLV